jgi:hypothetical protein
VSALRSAGVRLRRLDRAGSGGLSSRHDFRRLETPDSPRKKGWTRLKAEDRPCHASSSRHSS